MNILDEIAALQSRGLDILRAATELAPRDLVARAGISLAEARAWCRTARELLGPTRFTAYRRRVTTSAHNHRHSVQTLVLINNYARKLAAMDADHDTIAAAAREATRPSPEDADDTPRLRHRVDHRTKRMHFQFFTGMNQGRDLLHSVDAKAGSRTGVGLTDTDRGAALTQLLDGDGISPTTVTPMVIVGLDDATRIRDGHGDDVTLALTDGTTMTGAEFLAATLSDYSYVGLYHPVAGPANLYRTQRQFNRKQRLLARAESPVCAWPDCHRAAEACEAHHLTDWGEGGQTNASEVAMLCAYHNSVNRRRGRGHMIRDGDGLLKWVPPGGGAPLVKDHPVSVLGAMHLL
ncbi:hypothetical protein C3B44_00285 [Corynebacterium yudongzhengii]|uniref:HNH endonuclease n=1 Tax=Corynebacterium yudongzhengii TaxID=2080740 RepID=A0A2U1T4H6_9CORY|nr:HNH endonuclease signature motif containing protein [Corynebacterium yudongzhengii]AWB80978.1 hypothetical protein C3B44_00285 [Corynebacterium yudongzhengii]PWC00909.1 HNH endonuclease [Corynebacterium yudongzhengii]